MTRKVLLSLLFALAMAMTGCSSDSDDDVTPVDDTADNEALIAAEDYFNNTLKAVVTSNCTSCHSDYNVFDVAKAHAATMYNYVNSGEMPKDAAKLSTTDIDKFKEFKALVEAID